MSSKLRGLNKSEIAKLQKILEAQRKIMLLTNKDKVAREDFHVSQEDLMDEADLASSDIDQSMRMRMSNREALYLKKVEQALDRIKEGVYGECTSCGDFIAMKRLEARPTAELCIICKEEEEKKEKNSAVGRKPKSVGVSLGVKLG